MFATHDKTTHQRRLNGVFKKPVRFLHRFLTFFQYLRTLSISFSYQYILSWKLKLLYRLAAVAPASLGSQIFAIGKVSDFCKGFVTGIVDF